MGQIPDYPNDSVLQLSDKVLGTDSSNGSTVNFTISHLQSIADSNGYTRAQFQTLISNSGLKEGVRYKITDAGTGDVSIIVTAATTTTLFSMCLNLSDLTQYYTYNIDTDALSVYSVSETGGLTLVRLTGVEYAALPVKDPDTVYFTIPPHS